MTQTRLKFDRNEFAGSFGDIGTDFPFIVSLILICRLDPASVLIMFGLAQVLTGIIYHLPMPVQPLKAMAALAITQKLSGDILYGGGLSVGILMLFLTMTGLIQWLARIIPKVVVRGIQLGLGLQLATIALKDYVPSLGGTGYLLASISFFIVILLWENRRYPAAIFVIGLGFLYAFLFKVHPNLLTHSVGWHLPQWHTPSKEDIWTGFLVLALPQIALSLGNSILATRQVIRDFFPERKVTVQKISRTYSVLNLINPFFSGIPICHGSGGFAGHYMFGARTGGSVVIYGSMYLLIGLFLSQGFQEVIQLFPKPILGIILMFEGVALARLTQDLKDSKVDFNVAIITGLMAVSLPYGYLVGLVVGTLLTYWFNLRGRYEKK